MGHYKTSVGSQEPIHILAVQRAMIEHCEKMHDRFCLLDSLPGHNMQEAVEWRGRFDRPHAAFYFPWIKVRKGEHVLAPIPPSGHIPRSLAHPDGSRGLPRAPANHPIAQ